MTLKEFTDVRLGRLKERVEKNLARADKHTGKDVIHDLRVSIRRYTQALKSLPRVVEKVQAKETRRVLRPLMKLAGEVRDRDIVMQHLSAAGILPDSRLIRKIMAQRATAQEALAQAVREAR